jgi:hypothetical protein
MTSAAIGWGLPGPQPRSRQHTLGAALRRWWSACARDHAAVEQQSALPGGHAGRREEFIETAAMWREMDRL